METIDKKTATFVSNVFHLFPFLLFLHLEFLLLS